MISCQNGPESADKQVFRFNSSSGISSLDPAFARTQENIRAVNQLFNGLVRLDEHLNIEPCIAKSWKIDSTGTVYTFTIRNEVLFHKHAAFGISGTREVVAGDFVYSFDRIMAPETASDGAWIFNGTVDSIAPFVAPNDSTLVIKLQKPFPPFLGILTMAYCSVVPSEVCEENKEGFGKHPIGTGPFQFANWKPGVRMNFIRNDDYFEATTENDIPFLDAISISFIQNKQTELLEMSQGNLDAFSGLQSSYKDEILQPDGQLQSKYADDFKLLITPFLNTEFLAFQVQDPSVASDRYFRLAVRYAINRKAMIKYLRNNIGQPAEGGFTPKGLPGHIASYGDIYAPEIARKYLEQSSYRSGQEIKLYTTKDYLDLCILVQKDLEKIGVKLTIEVIPSPLLRQQKSSGDLSFFRGSWIADYPDAENYMACFYGPNLAPNGPNYCRFQNDSFDGLYQRMLNEVSDSIKTQLIYEMESILWRESPVIILFYDQSLWIHNKNVSGLKINALNHLDLRTARKAS